MSFFPSAIKSIAAYIPTINSVVTDIAMSPTVDPAHTMLVMSGWRRNAFSGFPDGTGSGYCTLLNGSTIRCVSSIPGGQPAILAVEFYGGFLRQPIQYGTVALAGVTNATVPITAVGPKAIVGFLGFNQNSRDIQTDMATQTPIVFLATTSSVQAYRYGTGGISAPDTIATVSFCVVDLR